MKTPPQRNRYLLPLLLIILVSAAWQCTPNGAGTRCSELGDSPGEVVDCVAYALSECPEEESPGGDEAQMIADIFRKECFSNAAEQYFADHEQDSPVEVPQVQWCPALHLTSPLDGMPNGAATFYWDGIGAPGAQYEIIVMDQDHTPLVTFPAGTNWNVSGDVSRAAIGGGYQFWVQIHAFANGLSCADEHLIMRAAFDFSQPPPSTPTHSPFGS